MVQEPGRALDLVAANRQDSNCSSPTWPPPDARSSAWHRNHATVRTLLGQVGWRQLALFDIDPDPAVVRTRAVARDMEFGWYCDAVVRAHATKYGWSKRQRNDVTRSLRLLQVLQDTPGAKIKATDVLELPPLRRQRGSTLDVLAEAGLLIDDRPTHVERFFASKTAHLPEPIKAQLEVWLEVMLHGSTTSPRRRSRDPQTARIHILGIVPIITAWAAAGHQSLAEITPEQVRAALPPSGSRRNFAEYGLKSLFTVLKGKKVIFTNPTRGMPATPVNASVPLPLEVEKIREALDSPDPMLALSVALVAFHALTDHELSELKLADIVDGRLTLSGRTIPLAGPVRSVWPGWLDHRARTWPNTINAHLLINQRTAPRLLPPDAVVGSERAPPQALREDRILQEIHATGGDVRRICDLFGLSMEAAMRYAATLGHPNLRQQHPQVPGTQDPK